MTGKERRCTLCGSLARPDCQECHGTGRVAKLPGMTEAQLQNMVLRLAGLFGWKRHHTRPARTNKGWRTPVQGDKGFPDLVLVHQARRRVLWIELKQEDGTMTPEQRQWRDCLLAAGQEWCCWRPSHWEEIKRILGG